MDHPDERFPDLNQTEWSPVRWAFNVWTWILIVVAIVAFEFFGDPLLAGLVLCLKFGGRDLWLGGSESTSLDPSNEFVAYAAMLMAADYI